MKTLPIVTLTALLLATSCTKNQTTEQPQLPTIANQDAQPYSNAKYHFKFTYPKGYCIDEGPYPIADSEIYVVEIYNTCPLPADNQVGVQHGLGMNYIQFLITSTAKDPQTYLKEYLASNNSGMVKSFEPSIVGRAVAYHAILQSDDSGGHPTYTGDLTAFKHLNYPLIFIMSKIIGEEFKGNSQQTHNKEKFQQDIINHFELLP